jgi:hypothetical protein
MVVNHRASRKPHPGRAGAKAFLTCALLCAASVVARAGTTYYVATNGDDKNPGTAALPFKTISHAADLVNPGDTVLVRNGVYADRDSNGWAVSVRRGGTAALPVLFKSENKWGAVIDGQAGAGTFGWRIACSYVTVQDFEVKYFWSHGVFCESGEHIVIRGNHIHNIEKTFDATPYGIDGCFERANCKSITYDSNVIHNIGRAGPLDHRQHDHGIYTCSSGARIVNNIIYNCDSGWCIQVAGYAAIDGTVISNNTFAWGSNRSQIVLWSEGGSISNLIIQNNIFYRPLNGNEAVTFYNAHARHTTIRNNLIYGGAPIYAVGAGEPDPEISLSGNIEGRDPRFEEAAKAPYDFHLQPGSPAIDAGIAALAPAADMDGKARPQGKGHDIGTYER